MHCNNYSCYIVNLRCCNCWRSFISFWLVFITFFLYIHIKPIVFKVEKLSFLLLELFQVIVDFLLQQVFVLIQYVTSSIKRENNLSGISAVDYTPSADKPVFSFFLYLSDSIDDVEKDVRVVDVYGKLSAIGKIYNFFIKLSNWFIHLCPTLQVD